MRSKAQDDDRTLPADDSARGRGGGLRSQGRTKEDLVHALVDLGYELWVFDAGSAQLRRPELPGEPDGNAIAAPRGWQPPVLG